MIRLEDWCSVPIWLDFIHARYTGAGNRRCPSSPPRNLRVLQHTWSVCNAVAATCAPSKRPSLAHPLSLFAVLWPARMHQGWWVGTVRCRSFHRISSCFDWPPQTHIGMASPRMLFASFTRSPSCLAIDTDTQASDFHPSHGFSLSAVTAIADFG